MPDCQDCDIFKEWSGLQTKVRENTDHRKTVTASGGTFERIWVAINSKISRGFLITVTVLIVGLVGTLFGLVYQSNIEILSDFGTIKADIRVIKTRLGPGE